MTRGWWDAYRGIPYLDHGRTRSGVDCWGLVRLVYAEQFGIELPGYDEEYAASNDVDLSIIEGRMDTWSQVERPREGDVVLMRILRRGKWLFHVGLVINARRGKMLHISDDIQVSTERYGSIRWARRVVGFWRHDARS